PGRTEGLPHQLRRRRVVLVERDVLEQTAQGHGGRRMRTAEPGRIQAAALPGELGAGAVQREEQHLDLAGGHRRVLDRGAQYGFLVHAVHARVHSGRSMSGFREEQDAGPAARALLVLELVQSSPGITADRLATELGVSERAARRYVGVLRAAGIPIES